MSAARRHLTALVLLVAVATGLLHPLIGNSRTHILTDDFQAGPGRSDAYAFLWGHWWVHTALSSGQSPHFCDWVYPPTGADLRFHTAPWVPALLTWPLSGFLDRVRLYNLSIAGLLVGAAFAMYLALSITFRLRFPVAVGFGALFGFCPYFLFKVHAHPNLAGAAFWASALALLVHALVRDRAGWRAGAVFAAALWATFWNSLVEFAMLAVAIGVLLVAALAARRFVARTAPSFRGPMRWALLAGLGAPSVLFFTLGAPEELEAALFPGPGANVWLGFPLLGLLGGDGDGRLFEYAGTGIPWGLSALAILGLARGPDRSTRALLALAAGTLALVALDPFGAVSGVVRTLPFGESLRVFARFFPFALYFVVVGAALAVDRAFAARRGAVTVLVAAGLAIAVVETVPRGVRASEVRSLDLSESVRSAMDGSRRVVVLPLAPPDVYPRRREAYQVELELPFVHMGHLTRESREARRIRAEAHPIFYRKLERVPEGFGMLDLWKEFDRVGVGYILFDQPGEHERFPLPGEVLRRTDREVLLHLPPPPARLP